MIDVKAQLATLLNKEMDRKDFLKYVAAAGFMAAGGSMLIRSTGAFDKLTQGSQPSGVKANNAYGMSPYGGRPTA